MFGMKLNTVGMAYLKKVAPLLIKIEEHVTFKQLDALCVCLKWVADGDIELDDVIKSCIALKNKAGESER